jgi:ATP-dependent DNA helicase DinG
MVNLTEFFGPLSPLDKLLKGFQPREGQANMAEEVAYAINEDQHLVVEAGTGIGKTFAYLVPAMLSDTKVIISTGTKTLQDQLYHRDLPLISKAIGRPISTALLKGRSNYLCLNRLNIASSNDRYISRDLNLVNQWRHQTVTGDKTELSDVSETSMVWPLVTSTIDNCLGRKCPDYQDCHVMKARKNAQESDLIVINHHLLFADLTMKEEGFAEFLPDAKAMILDEAHQIPDLAAQFFGVSIGNIELDRLCNELLVIIIPLNQPIVLKQIDSLRKALQQLLIEAPKKEGRYEFAQIQAEIMIPVRKICTALKNLGQVLIPLIDVTETIEKKHELTELYFNRISSILDHDHSDGLRWIDVKSRSLRLNLTPLDVGMKLRELFSGSKKSWIFTSATIAIGEDFSHFKDRIGLPGAMDASFPSPFAVKDNALIYLPKDLPEPSNIKFTEKMLEATQPLLKVVAGGIFFLFTSHSALNKAKDWFSKRQRLLNDRLLLVQGDSPRDDMLKKFRANKNAILLGTGSFWEGVDVRGEALNMVVIDKLPFKSPADPLMMARLEYIKKNGGNGFSEHQLPTAVLALKQGVGRLLRDEDDYGLVVLCDPRIKNKNYGKAFVNGLFPMKSTESLVEVKNFMEAHKSSRPQIKDSNL